MSNKNDILPEDLFDSLKNYESEFVPGDWEHMEALLDEDDDKAVPFVPPVTNQTNLLQKLKNNKLILLLMITLSTVGMATWMWFASLSPSTNSVEITSTLNSKNQNNQHLAEEFLEQNTNAKSPVYFNSDAIEKEGNINRLESIETTENTTKPIVSNSSSETLDENSTGFAQTEKSENEVVPQTKNQTINTIEETSSGVTVETNEKKETLVSDSIPETKTERQTIKKVVYRKEWVPPVYETTYLGFRRPIDDFWMGIHFTAQGDFGSDSFSTAGFNVQLMSGNRLKNQKRLGLYGGFDFGMQFMGKTPNAPVVLNTIYEDSGFARLSTRSYDFLARAHLEFAGGPVIPYLTAFAGPRIVATGQKVKSYMPLVDHERYSYTNVHTSASMLLGLGAGIRWQVGKHISIDTRYEYVGSSQAKTIDLNNTSFNGLSYNKVLTNMNTSYGMFKFGIIFNLSSERTESKKVAEGYYRETYYDSVSQDPNDTTTVYLPCPEFKECECDTIKDIRIPNYDDSNDDDDDDEQPSTKPRKRGRSTSPTHTPSTKTPTRSAPTIKPPAPAPKPGT